MSSVPITCWWGNALTTLPPCGTSSSVSSTFSHLTIKLISLLVSKSVRGQSCRTSPRTASRLKTTEYALSRASNRQSRGSWEYCEINQVKYRGSYLISTRASMISHETENQEPKCSRLNKRRSNSMKSLWRSRKKIGKSVQSLLKSRKNDRKKPKSRRRSWRE